MQGRSKFYFFMFCLFIFMMEIIRLANFFSLPLLFICFYFNVDERRLNWNNGLEIDFAFEHSNHIKNQYPINYKFIYLNDSR